MTLTLKHIDMGELGEHVHSVLSPIAHLEADDGAAALLAAYLIVSFPRVVQPEQLKRLMESCSLACGQAIEKELGVGILPSTRES